MADTTVKFDIFDDSGKKIVDAQPSPVTISGLTAGKTYKGYKAAYAGATAQTTLDDFTTAAATATAPDSSTTGTSK